MPYRVTCPACKSLYLIADDSLGRKFLCQKCQQPFIAGDAKAPRPSEAKPAAPNRPKPADTQPRPTVKSPPRRATVPSSSKAPADSATPPKKASRGLFGARVGALLFLGGVGVGIAISLYFFRRPQETAAVVQAAPTQGDQGGTLTSSAKKSEQASDSKTASLAPKENSSQPPPSIESGPAPTGTPPPPAPVAQEQPDPPVADRTELLRAAEVGKPFNYQLSHPTQKARSYTLHNGPKGLKISKEGLVQWTPEAGQEGTHRLLVGIVTDKMSGANIYTVRVNEAGASTLKPLPADLDLVPSKQAAFLAVQSADLWKDPALAPIRKLVETNEVFAPGLTRLKQMTGLVPGDIQRAVVVFWGKQRDPNSVVLVTTVKPFDRPRILGMIGEDPRTETINGKSILSSPKSEFALHLLNEYTFLYGRAVEVKRLLEQPARTTRSALWSGILHSAPKHALLIGVQHDLFPDDPKKQMPPPLKTLNPLLDAQTAMASLDAGKELHLTVRLTFARDAQAQVAEGAARQGLNLAAGFLSQFAQQFKKQAPGQLPPPFDKLVAGAQAAEASLNKATIQVKDRVLECQVKVQSTDRVEAVAAAALFFFAPRPTKPGAASPGPPPLAESVSPKGKEPKTPEEAEAAIKKMGGEVHRNEFAPGKPITEVKFKDVNVTDDDLVLLRPIGTLEQLWLRNNKEITDKGMEYLAANLPRLQRLILGENRITDAGLAHLSKLTNLDSLWVSKCRITDNGLIHLRDLKKLDTLTLKELSDVTDAGLVHLKDLVKLTHLNLDYCRITDEGLAHLKILKKLTHLTLKGNAGVTDKGVAELKKALPKANISK